jgi:hypothetical protein
MNSNASEFVDLEALLKSIRSDEFLRDIKTHGINAPSITINPHLGESSIRQKFIEEGKNCFELGSEYDVKVLFHGTDERNVDAILRDGLDPSLRKRQVFGQGEYFAMNPATTMKVSFTIKLRMYCSASKSYDYLSFQMQFCCGGRKILIFAVITEPCDMRHYRHLEHIFVVKKSERQLPIGTLSFDWNQPYASMVSDSFQTAVTNLKDEVKKKEEMLQEAHTKEKIVRLIIRKEYNGASEIYNKACDKNNGRPPKSWAEEVATYVRDHIRDHDEVDIYFPNLPCRPVKSINVFMLNSETCEAEVVKAKRKYEALTKEQG